VCYLNFCRSPPLQVLTKDSVTVSVDAVVYYRVSNATVSIANVENAHHSTRLLAQTTLRNTMGTRQLHEILSERMTISGSMQVSEAKTFLIYHETKCLFVALFISLKASARRSHRSLGNQSRTGWSVSWRIPLTWRHQRAAMLRCCDSIKIEARAESEAIVNRDTRKRFDNATDFAFSAEQILDVARGALRINHECKSLA
jgi:SPFH domain / Band 7 family